MNALYFTWCNVEGGLGTMRISTKARLRLQEMVFDECGINFRLIDLANIMLLNDSLKQQLSIMSYTGCIKDENIILKDL